MRLLKPKLVTAGDKKVIEGEPDIKNVEFNIFKFTNREIPADPNNIVFVGCFSEFGCEVLGVLYTFEEIRRQIGDKYLIAFGWYGREYLYRHLVDEYWEIKEEHMWLREYSRAFHNESKNLKKIEKKFEGKGIVLPSDYLGRLVVGARCRACKAFWGTTSLVLKCVKCESTDIKQSLFGDVVGYKPQATLVPQPSDEKKEYVRKYLGPNPVGVFARNRQCYGRNLQPEFYVKLIEMLRKKGYTPIWLGEKQSTLPCPVADVVDFSRMEEAHDLELTLAIVSQLKFTVQYWTASTRLAGLMGVPFILFESPDQILGNGQEGFRLNLCSFGPKKVVFCHYLNVYNDNEGGVALTEKSIDELMAGQDGYTLGMLESDIAVKDMLRDNLARIGG